MLVKFPIINVWSMFQQLSAIDASYIKRIEVSPFHANIICVASKNTLFKSMDNGQTFFKKFVSKDAQIQHAFSDPQIADILYVATERHFYKIADSVQQLFTASDEEIIMTAVKYQGTFFIGTTKGLYSASEELLNWTSMKKFTGAAVYHIEPAAGKLYIAASGGVYIITFSGGMKISAQQHAKVFPDRGNDDNNENDDEEYEKRIQPTIIKKDMVDKNRILLGTTQGIYAACEGDLVWEKMNIEGIDTLSINCLLQRSSEPQILYAATNKGLFKVNTQTKTSQNIFEGIATPQINWVAAWHDLICLATADGAFVSKSETVNNSVQKDDFAVFFEDDPAIEEIQQAALRHNEVHPDKIKQWRQAVKSRALFPEISLDYSKTIYGAYGASYQGAIVGPRDWGISIKWDVGDLIWNSYEDDIDTRSRLNTQLRLDILDEVNRIYFERMRLKSELMTAQGMPQEELFKKKLRLQELTAMLDGYTGGMLSKRVRQSREAK